MWRENTRSLRFVPRLVSVSFFICQSRSIQTNTYRYEVHGSFFCLTAAIANLHDPTLYSQFDMTNDHLDIELRDEEGNLLLHINTWISDEQRRCYVPQRGSDVNAKNHHGETPLLLADFAKPRIIKLLLRARARVLLANRIGQSPMDLAGLSHRLEAGSIEVAQDYLQHIARIIESGQHRICIAELRHVYSPSLYIDKWVWTKKIVSFCAQPLLVRYDPFSLNMIPGWALYMKYVCICVCNRRNDTKNRFSAKQTRTY